MPQLFKIGIVHNWVYISGFGRRHVDINSKTIYFGGAILVA